MTIRPIRIDGDVAYITLTKGYTAVIDAADVDIVAGYNWCVNTVSPTGHMYGFRGRVKSDVGKGNTYLHRAIIGDTGGMEVDHIDGNGLNNTRSNLRLVSRSQNMCNARPYSGSLSKYKGVSPVRSGRWSSRIFQEGKRVWLGTHDTEEAAYAAYCEASERLHGEFGRVE